MLKKFYFLISMLCSVLFAFAQPATPATDPTAASADVISVYSDAYTNVAGTDFFPNWSQSTVVADFPIGMNNTKRLTNFNYQGVQFAAPINASAMQNVHIDLWSSDCTTFEFYLVNTSPGTVEQKFNITPIIAGWNSIDIPLSHFTNINLANIGQFKFVSVPFGGTTVYYDNIYFWKSASTPTLSNFSIPAQLVGASPVTITPPMSNSTGAFTYTSSNTSVATVSGNMLTIVGAGTSTITATQAPAGSFGQGSITTVLTVSFAPPTVAATDPTAAAADVISVYSDTYTNVAGTDFFPNWSQSTAVADFPIGANNTKRMTNFNYQGIQLAAPINASTMQNLHIDLWSPNCTTFELYLINTGPTVEQKFDITPITAGWNSIDIPLSHYTSINLANIGQFKFVSVPSGTTVYYDNLYFWKAPNTPNLSNFSIPAQVTGAMPVTITAPTSNSMGAFTYTSSNANVATVSGNTLTIVGVGTSTITATQAPAGIYGQGVITTTLTVTYGPPPTAAPAAPALTSPNLYSLYSDVFTPTNGQPVTINWNPGWGQSTQVSDIMVAGNTTRRYDNMNYQGVEFTPAINVSSYNRLHIDIWTPNCTEFKVFLIDVRTPLPTIEQSVTLTPNNTGWNSFDIDLSMFRNIQVVDLTTVDQMKFEATPFGTSNVFMDNLYFYNTIGLPITLSSFKATANRNTVDLTWKTLSETNNKGFQIEKSTDGFNFTAIGFVNGNGNRSTPSNYQFKDLQPSFGTNYYRLKQIDFNNTFEYSTIEAIKIAKSKIAEISFYPNPVVSNLQVNVSEVFTNNATVNIINGLGQVVLSKSVPKATGNTVLNFDVTSITDGVYYLQLIDGKDRTVEKIVIAKN